MKDAFGAILIITFFLAGCAKGAEKSGDDFVVVFFDDESAKALQLDAPLPRGLKARFITKLAEAGARGLVVKFFEDLPGDAELDKQYARALCLLPTTLEACLRPDGSTHALPARFLIAEPDKVDVESVMAGDAGYLPLPQFTACARGVGFVDLERRDGIPLVEGYRGKLVKSLYVTALELETGHAAVYRSNAVSFGDVRLSFNKLGEHVIRPPLPEFQYLPFHRVIDGSIPASRLSGKVVIFGYAGAARIHSIQTPWGKVEAHRLFVQSLLALSDDLQPAKAEDVK